MSTLRKIFYTIGILVFILAIYSVAKAEGETATAHGNHENQNLDSIAIQLDKKKQSLAEKEVEIQNREKRLQEEEVQLDEKIKELKALREGILSIQKEQMKDKEDRVVRVVTVFETMQPKVVAQVFETLDDWLAVEVLKKMETKKVAKVMNLMDKNRSAKLSELLTGFYKTPFEREPANVDSKKNADSTAHQNPINSEKSNAVKGEVKKQ